jgi:hypothetical protein
MRTPRFRLITASLVVHAAVVIALFIAGFWRLDRLEGPRHTVDIVQPGPPPPAPSGGPEVAKAEPFKQKQQRKIIKELRQPEQIKEQVPLPTATKADGGGGTGDGTGPGQGSGSAGDTGDCTEDCGPSDTKKETKPEPVVEKKPPVPVAPPVIRGMRISGETQIQMNDVDKTSLLRSGKANARASVKVCVGETGQVTSLAMYAGSGYAAWDSAIMGAMRNRRYKPHQIDNRPVMVCGIVTFVYALK